MGEKKKFWIVENAVLSVLASSPNPKAEPAENIITKITSPAKRNPAENEILRLILLHSLFKIDL
jgi:hypothetical protein